MYTKPRVTRPSRLVKPANLQPDQLTLREREALRLISEQATLPLDLLGRLLDVRLPEAEELVADLEHLGCLHSRQIRISEVPWVWLGTRGARLADSGFPALKYPPAPASLDHHRAIAEVRLYMQTQASHGRWVCERQLQRRRETGGHVADGVFEVDGERHAIEVELSTKSQSHLERVVLEHSRRYDAVIYWCGPEVHPTLCRFKAAGGWPKLVVRRLPFEPKTRRKRIEPSRLPRPAEVGVLRLISEQGAIPVDQLARFLRSSPNEADRMLSNFSRANFLHYEKFLAGETKWAWLTRAGARLSGSSLRTLSKLPDRTDRLRALNDLRLHLEPRTSGARWISQRQLRQRLGTCAKLPGAVIETDDERHAINVRLRVHHVQHFLACLDHHNSAYDAVIVFCATRHVRRQVERLQAEHRWSKLVIRDLPQSAPGPVEVGRTRICGTRSVR